MKKLIYTFIFLIGFTLLTNAQNNTRWKVFYDVQDGKSYYLVWDIKTGKSLQYFWSGNDTKWITMEINLPAVPLVGATGNVLWEVYYDRGDKKAYYLCWDSKTGKSIQYYWNGSETKWSAMEINLPANPIAGSKGEIIWEPYYDDQDGKAYYMVYDSSTGESVQYYWNGNETKWSAMEINLPKSPLVK